MTLEESFQIIQQELSHVPVLDLYVEFDSHMNQEIVKVLVWESDLGDAFGPEGCHARRAAMRSQRDIEIVTHLEVSQDDL